MLSQVADFSVFKIVMTASGSFNAFLGGMCVGYLHRGNAVEV